MEIKAMARKPTGYVFQDKRTGFWYARVTFTNQQGIKRNVKRRVDDEIHGERVLKKLVRTYEDEGAKAFDIEKLTFNHLCGYYEQHYAQPAQYANGRKVAGLRSVVQVKGYINIYREYFGKRLLKSITYDDLRTFRAKRLKTSTHQSQQRSLTTVNREMAYLRRLLNIAERNGWVARNAFKLGDTLIHVSDEVKRERVINRMEEGKLLAECVGYRAHLRPVIIAALDTGCRLGELLKLRWRDVDIDAGLITIQAFNTKTMRQRQVSITSRLKLELEQILDKPGQDINALVFGITSNIRQGFKKACKDAGLEGLRFHDLRHSHATRLDDLGFSLAKIGGQLGHTVMQTTLRYVNRDKAAIRQVASALDAYHVEGSNPADASEMVN